MTDEDGEIIWRESYELDNFGNHITSIRETDDGIVASGQSAVSLIKVDPDNGEIIWSRNHNSNLPRTCEMVSTVNGGFAFALWDYDDDSIFELFKVNGNGQREWYRQFQEDNGNYRRARSLARLRDGGFAVVGQISDGGYFPLMIRTNSAGVERWRAVYNFEGIEGLEGNGRFHGVTGGRDGSIVAAGTADVTENHEYSQVAILMKLEPLVLEPVIFGWLPEDTVFTVLLGDTISFMARARDQQGDELSNLWIFNEDTLGVDTVETVFFGELGEHLVQCIISDGENTTAIGWRVTAEEFYLESYHPDNLSLIIRRNTEVNFSLGVRAIEGVEPDYSWTMTDRENRPIDIGNEAETDYTFNLAGEFSLEGMVFHEQVEHSVRWQIAVNSVLWWWRPHARQIEAELREQIEFSVIPFNPDSDSLDFLWLVDGEDDGDHGDGIFTSFNNVGEHTVTAIVHDGEEVDTVVWTISVVEPDDVREGRASLIPTDVTLYPAAPNPFNSTSLIRYFLPRSAEVRLMMYDSAGRLVQILNEGLNNAGEHIATLHGSELSAGVYLLQLETGDAVRTMKVVLLK